MTNSNSSDQSKDKQATESHKVKPDEKVNTKLTLESLLAKAKLKTDSSKTDSQDKKKEITPSEQPTVLTDQDTAQEPTAKVEDTASNNNQSLLRLPSTDLTFPVIPLKQGLLFPRTETVLTFGRKFSVKAIKEGVGEQKLVVLVAQKKASTIDPTTQDLYQVGVLAVIERTLKTDGNLTALVRGLDRVKINQYLQTEPYFLARVTKLSNELANDQEELVLTSHLRQIFQKIVQMGKPVEFLNFIKLMSGIDASEMADQIATTLNISTSKKQDLLETLNVKERVKKLIKYLNQEMNVIEIEKDVVYKTQEKFDKHMRESVLRERLRTIKKELGEYEDSDDMAQNYLDKLKKLRLPPAIKSKVKKEIQRLESMSPNNPETSYITTWLDTIFEVPWRADTTKRVSLKKAKKTLDETHYGLEDVKERILEYMAVLQLKSQTHTQDKKPGSKNLPTILCFVGPPGVGKTSIGQAIAKALGRKFTKVSLGGIRDEAEIRGHRRTYVGAMPGRIIKGIIAAQSKNPVFILDEIDKLGNDFRGDPSAALLEVLDPEQNYAFEDHYLDIPYDLSQVIFVTTANTLATVPPALRDRLEIIEYPGYTYSEKFNIAKNHLVKKVLLNNGLNQTQLQINDQALKMLIQRYSKEAGVRDLERKLGKVARKVAKMIVLKKNDKSEKKSASVKSAAKSLKKSVVRVKPVIVNPKIIRQLLGPEEYDLTLSETQHQVGVATGLAWTQVGGDLLFIEVALTEGKGKIVMTGKLGEVMQESAQAALTFVKSHAKQLGIKASLFAERDVHIHVPEGAIPKDGPSAGITLATAICSAFTNKPVNNHIAMTGEITLRGRVLRIGGLKEKAIAAHLAKIPTVIIPQENERNLEELPEEVRREIKFIPVDNALKVIKLALTQ